MVDIAILRTELATDPLGLGYAAEPSAQLVADLLTLVRPALIVRRADISAAEIAAAIDVADFPALSGNPNAQQLSRERQYLAWLAAILSVPAVRLLHDDGSPTPVIANFQVMFPAGTGTRARLVALAERPGSRAEQLFGPGVRVTHEDVAQARRGA